MLIGNMIITQSCHVHITAGSQRWLEFATGVATCPKGTNTTKCRHTSQDLPPVNIIFKIVWNQLLGIICAMRSWGLLLCDSPTTITSYCSMIVKSPCCKYVDHWLEDLVDIWPMGMFEILWSGVSNTVFQFLWMSRWRGENQQTTDHNQVDQVLAKEMRGTAWGKWWSHTILTGFKKLPEGKGLLLKPSCGTSAQLSCSSNRPGSWSQMIWEVNMLDWVATPGLGSQLGGHFCPQHTSCTLPQTLRNLWHCAVW